MGLIVDERLKLYHPGFDIRAAFVGAKDFPQEGVTMGRGLVNLIAGRTLVHILMDWQVEFTVIVSEYNRADEYAVFEWYDTYLKPIPFSLISKAFGVSRGSHKHYQMVGGFYSRFKHRGVRRFLRFQ